MATPPTLEQARGLVAAASARQVTLRLLGGTAILHQCPSARDGPIERRSAPDVDVAGLTRQNRDIRALFESVGYAPNASFNALHGYKRLMFAGPGGGPKVDVFLDRLHMSHNLDFRGRLDLDPVTLSVSDLLFTKLQVVELNEKDMRDIAALLLDHEVANTESAGRIDASYLAALTAGDWGIYTTFTDNLVRLREAVGGWSLEPAVVTTVRERSGLLHRAMESAPKSLSWKLRARVGRRVAWYELPDEPKAIPLGGSR